MITPLKGQFHIEWFPKTASTTFAQNDMVSILSTVAGAGTLIKSTSASTKILGLCLKTVAATDSDYASTTEIPVLVANDQDCEFLMDVSTGIPATTDIGELVGIDDENSVDITDYATGVIEVVRVISSTQIVGKILKKSGVAVAVTA